MATSPQEIAEWMYEQFQKSGRLVQNTAAMQIRQRFGPEHTTRNRNGNWGIDKPILDAFRKLTPDDVVWSRSQQLWRRRQPRDPEGKRMVR